MNIDEDIMNSTKSNTRIISYPPKHPKFKAFLTNTILFVKFSILSCWKIVLNEIR